jgi:signal peptidase I
MPARFIILSILLSVLFACAQEKRFTQPTTAMEPTVLKDEHFAVDMNAYASKAPARGDVIIFSHDDVLEVKRVIAVAGDTIEGRDFQIRVNGGPVHQGYIQHTGKDAISPPFSFLKSFGPITIMTGQIFVMGDNRDFSDDSRDPKFGLVFTKEARGQAVRIVKSSDPQREGIAIH